MFGKETITRKCVMTLEGGFRFIADITIPKPTKPTFPEVMERRLVEQFNKSQPMMRSKAVRCHILRN